MVKLESLLESRLSKSEEKPVKVRSLAERSNKGQLSGYSTLLGSSLISLEDKKLLQDLLSHYKKEESISFTEDLEELSHLTQEVRSITQQSILLHGERIQKAQKLLSSYTDGAFSAWLITVYGNRQTPYNFLLYYQFYMMVEESLRFAIEEMPKQAVYTLAGRDAPLSEKIELIRAHKGMKKEALLEEIRRRFPLKTDDKRKGRSIGTILLQSLRKIKTALSMNIDELTEVEKKALKKEIREISNFL